MKNKVFITSVLYVMLLESNSTSIVYNLRVAEATKTYGKGDDRSFQGRDGDAYSESLAVTLFDQLRRTNQGGKQNLVGTLTTLSHQKNGWYIKGDFAWAHIDATTADMVHASRTQCDDFLITAGYSFHHHDRTNITFSGLFGIPLHRDNALRELQFGTGHVAVGVQLDLAYRYLPDMSRVNNSLLFSVREIHFFPRTVVVPILGQERLFNFTSGDLIDLFCAHSSVIDRHSVEFGYDATFLTNVSIDPAIAGVAQQIQFSRSSFYTSYQYRFKVGDHPSRVILGLSYASDHRFLEFGLSWQTTMWVTWTLNF